MKKSMLYFTGLLLLLAACTRTKQVHETWAPLKEAYRDAFMIEENIAKELLHVVRLQGKQSSVVSVVKGEEEVVSLFSQGNYDAIASDDRRFLKKLDAANIPYLTPAACLIYLYKSKKIKKAEVTGMLEALKPFISRDEHAVAKLYLEDQS